MIGFVILHYVREDLTDACVESILSRVSGEIAIAIVDNASPNESGQRLKEKYASDSRLHVLLNDSNEGFSRGNNVGYRYLRDTVDPDFIVVLNNDTIIEQYNFTDLLTSAYRETGFDILGPDIFSVSANRHQNPQPNYGYDENFIKKSIRKWAWREEHPFVFTIKATIARPYIDLKNHLIARRSRADFSEETPQVGVILHGACLIFSRKFIERHENAFYPKNFMHHESEILHFFAQNEGLKEVYYPRIHILHYEDMATETVYSKAVEKEKFLNKCMLDSGRILLELLESKSLSTPKH